jgi:hypothetical protein
LFADTFRGPHSTGVFTRRSHSLPNRAPIVTIPILKKEGIAPDFLRHWDWHNILKSGADPTKYKYGDFYVGHNRYATQGAVNEQNAHPFKYGDITLVHNGTLLDQSTLPDFHKFEVDSENICHSINKIGAKKTIALLDGAFTLIWHDASDDTLHIIRNEERPFHLAETATGWFGASEEGMLTWVLGRDTKTYVHKHFECEAGTEYIFDTSFGFKFKEKVEREMLDPYYGFGMYGQYGSYRNQRQKPRIIAQSPVVVKKNDDPVYTEVKETPLQKKRSRDVDTLLEQHRFPNRGGQVIEFKTFKSVRYKDTPDSRCKVTGYVEGGDYIEVECHAVDAADYVDDAVMSGKIVGAYEKSGTLYIICTHDEAKISEVDKKPHLCPVCDKEAATPFDIVDVDGGMIEACQECYIMWGQDLAPPFESPDRVVNVGGTLYSKDEWDKSVNTCGCCDETIEFLDADGIDMFSDTPICKNCETTMQDFVFDGSSEAADMVEDTFVCLTCTQEFPIYLESTTPRVCTICHDSFHGPY